MKEKLKKFGEIAGRICCTCVGLFIAGYGVSYFIPKKQYSHSEVSVKEIPTSKDKEEL
jgi:hypothetical protein